MSEREQVAKELADKDGRKFELLNEVLTKAYLHNADCAIADREQIAIASGKAEVATPICSVCKGIGWLGQETPCHECNPVGLVNEVVPETAPETPQGEPPVVKDNKPHKLLPGEYICSKCAKPHRKTSKLGIKHLSLDILSEGK